MSSCILCERTPLAPRVYYDRESWYAFLASPPYVDGHSILAVKKSEDGCPSELTLRHLRGLDVAIAEVVHLLMQHFQPKDVLFASLRGREPHVHLHLVPLWEDVERPWRSDSGHPRGHLFEFLGVLEKSRQSEHDQERNERGWTEDEQRIEYLPHLKPHIDALRALSPNRTA